MTSLIGASGEDFGSILRSLGYRMERRPKPPEPPTAAIQLSSETVASEAPSETALDSALDLPREAAVPVDSANAPPDPANVLVAPDLSASPQATSAQATSAQAPNTQETPAGSGSSQSDLQSAAAPAEAAQEPASAVAPTTATDRGEAALPTKQAIPTEQEMIEVWRPGRAEGRRRAHARPHGRARQARIKPSAAAPELAQDGNAAPAQTTALPATTDLAIEGAHTGANARQQQRFRQRRKPEHRTDRQQRERPPVKRFERREKMPDPNSPFAKLASLKAQLEADAKERR
jgi:ATP-dependent RNA helicase SUPV3L1/SUV3